MRDVDRQALKEKICDELSGGHITIVPSPASSPTLISGSCARINTRRLGEILAKLGRVVVVWGYGLKMPIINDYQDRFLPSVAAVDEVEGHPNRWDIGLSQSVAGDVVVLYYQERCTFPLLQAMGGTGSQTFGSVQQVFMMPVTTVTDKDNKVWAMDACCAATKHYSASWVHLLKAFKALTKKGRSAGGIPPFGSNGLVGGRALRRMEEYMAQLLKYCRDTLDRRKSAGAPTRSTTRLELTCPGPTVEVAIARANQGGFLSFDSYARRPGESSGTVEVAVPVLKVPLPPPALPPITALFLCTAEQPLPLFCSLFCSQVAR